MPDAQISAHQFEFGECKYLRSSTRTLEIENVGQVLCQFRFIPKLGEKLYCKPWLRIHPPIGMALPGERVAITLTLMVDHLTVGPLNTGAEKLEDIVILHLEHGKDYFISVSGDYQPTCFGQSLSSLVATPNPVRHTTESPAGAAGAGDGAASQPVAAAAATAAAEASAAPPPGSASPAARLTRKLHIPKELWQLVDMLFKHGLAEPNLFLVSGAQTEIEVGVNTRWPRLL